MLKKKENTKVIPLVVSRIITSGFNVSQLLNCTVILHGRKDSNLMQPPAPYFFYFLMPNSMINRDQLIAVSQYLLLLASHSLRSISRGNITNSLNSKSVILDFVYSGSR